MDCYNPVLRPMDPGRPWGDFSLLGPISASDATIFHPYRGTTCKSAQIRAKTAKSAMSITSPPAS